MIAFVKGIVAAVDESRLVVDIGGVGLELLVPLTQLQPYPQAGDEIYLHTHLQVREDGWQLFGFASAEQLRIFRRLIAINGVGPKMALAICDSLSPQRLIAAVAAGDEKAFCAVSGVGKKIAQRLLLELKDKFSDAELAGLPQAVAAAPAMPAAASSELTEALKQLGYSATEARALALQVQEQLPDEHDTGRLLTAALRMSL